MPSQASIIKSQTAQDDLPQLVRTALIPQNGVWIVGNEDAAVPVATRLPNVVAMNGNDMLYLQVDVTILGASPIEMRVEFAHDSDSTVAANWYPECALEPAALALGIVRSGVAHLIYSFTVTGKYRIPITMDDKAARISIQSNGAPNVGDLAAVTALRRIRDSLVSP